MIKALPEPLRKLKARRRSNRAVERPDPRFDLVLAIAVVAVIVLFRRRLGRAATERTGTWVGTIR